MRTIGFKGILASWTAAFSTPKEMLHVLRRRYDSEILRINRGIRRKTMKKRFLSVIICLCALVSVLSVTLCATTAKFSDVKDSDYFATPVSWAVEKGITVGTSATSFSPNSTCTRAQILTFMWRAAGSPEPKYANFYTDVKESDYFYKAALWAREKGVHIPSDELFRPNTPCTRASTVEYFWRLAGAKIGEPVPFSDIDRGSVLENAVSWAVENGITAGTGGTNFTPNTVCTRAQIVTFLYRYYVAPTDNSALIETLRKTVVQGSMKLDPPIPEDYRLHPDWYGSLTPPAEMSDERLLAEYEYIQKAIADFRARGIYMSDGPYSRELDLWSEASRRDLLDE